MIVRIIFKLNFAANIILHAILFYIQCNSNGYKTSEKYVKHSYECNIHGKNGTISIASLEKTFSVMKKKMKPVYGMLYPNNWLTWIKYKVWMLQQKKK